MASFGEIVVTVQKPISTGLSTRVYFKQGIAALIATTYRFSEADRVPILLEIAVNRSANTATLNVYDEPTARSAKSIGGITTYNITTGADEDDPKVAEMLNCARAISGDNSYGILGMRRGTGAWEMAIVQLSLSGQADQIDNATTLSFQASATSEPTFMSAAEVASLP